MKRYLVLLASVLALCSCGGAIEDISDYTGTISGIVSCSGEPVSGVEVNISPVGKSYVTRSDGSYTFSSLDSGSYNLVFSKTGYVTATRTLTVSSGRTTSGDVSLVKNADLVSIDKELLDFGNKTNSLKFTLANKGDELVSWEVDGSKLPSWLILGEFSDDIVAHGTNTVSVNVDRSKVEGNSGSASVDVNVSNGQIFTLKVTVKAGDPAEVKVYAREDWIGYDWFALTFEMSDNCTHFKLGLDWIGTRTIEWLLEEGYLVDYDTDEDPIVWIDLDDLGVAGMDLWVYVIPYNEYEQIGTLGIYLIPLKRTPDDDPASKYTAIKDIRSAGSYNVKDATVYLKADNGVIISDDGGRNAMFVRYDSMTGKTLPSVGDIVEISGEAVMCGNVLTFKNPTKMTKTGTGDANWSFSELSTYWKANDQYIDSYEGALAFCGKSSALVSFVLLDGILSDGPDGPVLTITDENGAYPQADLVCKLSPTGKASNYVGQVVRISGVTVGYEDGAMQIVWGGIQPHNQGVTLDDYIGYWDVSAYDWDNYDQSVLWEGAEIFSYEDASDGSTWVGVAGIMKGYGYEYFCAYGRFDETTHSVKLLRGYGSSYTFCFNSDPDTYYKAYFYPILASSDGSASYIADGSADDGRACMRLVFTDSGSLALVPDIMADSNGRYGNGFVFRYSNADTGNYVSRFSAYIDVTLTPSTTYSSAKAAALKTVKDRMINEICTDGGLERSPRIVTRQN